MKQSIIYLMLFAALGASANTHSKKAAQFKKADLDKNGTISLKEYTKLVETQFKAKNKKGYEKAAATRFKARDANKDAKLTLEEFSTNPGAKKKSQGATTDKPKATTTKPTAKTPATPVDPKKAAQLKKFDANKDGKIDQKEFTAMTMKQMKKKGVTDFKKTSAKNFKRKDKNKDGFITVDELGHSKKSPKAKTQKPVAKPVEK
jgi:Ca2+-binding EF-hand superfamily protein